MLVWMDQGDFLVVSKMTSRIKGRQWDVAISPDSHNGLSRESVVQVDRTIKIPKSKICDIIPRGCINQLQLALIREKLRAFRESTG